MRAARPTSEGAFPGLLGDSHRGADTLVIRRLVEPDVSGACEDLRHALDSETSVLLWASASVSLCLCGLRIDSPSCTLHVLQ